MLDVEISDAAGALINIIGGEDLSLDESKRIIETVGSRLNSEAKMIWGAQISEDMEKTIRVMLIVTGEKSKQIVGSRDPASRKEQKDIEDELGIEFLEE